jgi:hypothetical protein
MMSLEEWRQAIKTPPAYRFGNSTLRFQTKYVVLVFIVTLICLLYIILPTGRNVNNVSGKTLKDT